MKILFFLLGSVLLFSFCKTNIDQEKLLAEKVNISTKNKNWEEAEACIDKLIKDYPKSKNMINYLEALEWVLSEKYYLIRKNNTKKEIQNNKKGTIIIRMKGDYGNKADSILIKTIFTIERYLNKFPENRNSPYYLEKLLGTYRELGDQFSAKLLAYNLLNSKNIPIRIKSAEILGHYAHACGQYELANVYYDVIINTVQDSCQIMKYHYFKAICYYELDDLKMAKKELDYLFSFPKIVQNKCEHIFKIAEITKNFISKLEKNPKIPKRHFIFFEGVNCGDENKESRSI